MDARQRKLCDMAAACEALSALLSTSACIRQALGRPGLVLRFPVLTTVEAYSARYTIWLERTRTATAWSAARRHLVSRDHRFSSAAMLAASG